MKRKLLAAWDAVRPHKEAAYGASIAAMTAALAMTAYTGWYLRFGLGRLFDTVAAVLVGLVILLLSKWAAQIIRWALPARTLGVLVASAGLLSLTAGPSVGVLLALWAAIAGASLISVWINREGRARRIVWRSLAVLSVAAFAGLTWLFAIEGFSKEFADAPLSSQPKVASLALPDPGARGPFEVESYSYSGRTVDASKLLKDREGWHGKVRKWYWGFDAKKLPLNARVWRPRGAGPFPLVLVVHGNHLGPEASDPGYEYLGELFASRGFILASIDENFLNFMWEGDYNAKEQPARAWLLLEHLKLWREWGKADLGRVVLIGHSRGGEAAATATEFNRLSTFPGDGRQTFDYHFGIRGVIAIAPSDGQYRPAGMPRRLRDVSYFVIHGGWDADVSSFVGSRQYAGASFSPGFDGFKSELWIYRANHGQFNTVWGKYDSFGLSAWLLNTRALLKPEIQRRIAEVYFSAFLEDVLHGKHEYRRLFEDYRAGAPWLPDTTYVNRFQDASFTPLAQYDEDYDISRSTAGGQVTGDKLTTWKEQRLGGRFGDRENNVVYLGWRDAASYTLSVPEGLATGMTALEFSLADANEMPSVDNEKKAPDPPKTPLTLTVELEDAAGKSVRVPLKDAGPVYKPLKIGYRKVPVPGDENYTKETEPVLQRYLVPLDGLDAAKVKAVRFRFDSSTPGTVVMDDIGFSRHSR